MEFKEAVKKLKDSSEIKDLDKDNYLAHGFMTLDENFNESQPWNIGFYSKKTDKITSYSITDNVIEKLGEQEVFKDPDDIVQELEIEKVKKTMNSVISSAKKLIEKKYSKETPARAIVLVQNIKDIGTVWNITIITKQFNTINVKMNSYTGKIVEDKIVSLLQYKAQ
jgi:hypothetical protein